MAAYLATDQALEGHEFELLSKDTSVSMLKLREAVAGVQAAPTDAVGDAVEAPMTDLSQALTQFEMRMDAVSGTGDQDLMTKTAKLSPIVELVAGSALANRLAQLAKLEDAGATPGRASQILLDLGANQIQLATESGASGEQQSGFHELSERSQRETQQPLVQNTSRDFREVLAEHLRKADNLRELSDRLGTMIARQITGQIAKGQWTLEMALHPAELGSIEVEMEMTERGLEASFKATQSVTRDLLMESMTRLKSWFEEGGIDVAYAGLSQDSGAQNGGNSTADDEASSDQSALGGDEGSDGEPVASAIDLSNGFDVRV
jgi:flagellar hook-length control protein FliK